MKRICALAATTVLLAATALTSGALANTLYSQPWDGTGNLFASQNDTTGGNGNFATVYDDFTLGGSATVTGVDFTGGYFNPASQGTITGFTIQIYSDAGNAPGASVYSEFVPGTAGESTFGCGGFLCSNYALAANFTATAGTKYWLSIVPDVGFPPQWGWASGTGGDGLAYQDFFGTRSQLADDMAFTLTGGVPEPATWAMMLVGFMVLGAGVRSRRRAALAI